MSKNILDDAIDYTSLSEQELDNLFNTPYIDFSLNEMAINRSQFRTMCNNLCTQILYNIVNIIILGNYELFHTYINHWKTELMSHINLLNSRTCEKSVKRCNIIYDNIISIATGSNTWKWNNEEIVENALKDEIRKGSKSLQYKKEILFIKYNILHNIDNELEIHANEFIDIFKSLYMAFKENNMNIFTKTLDKYTS